MIELFAELRRRGRSAATLKRAEQKLGHFPRIWGAKRLLKDLENGRLVNEYIDKRLTEPGVRKGDTVKRITIRDELAFLRQMLKLARRQGRFASVVEDVLPLIFETGHKPHKDFIPWKDLPRLLLHVPGHRISHVLFFCVCGGRLADSFRARRKDFDTSGEEWRITVHGSKTDGSTRTIPAPQFLRPFVEQLLERAPTEEIGKMTTMLVPPRAGLLFYPWPNIDRDLKAACARARVNPVSTNGLRRTFGKALRVHGFDLETISKLFGHTTTKLAAEVYADVEGDELAAVVEQQETRGKPAKNEKRTKAVQATPKTKAKAGRNR